MCPISSHLRYGLRITSAAQPEILKSRCLQISTVIGAAVKSQREDSGWSEGVAIWVAVLIVSFVGEPLLLPDNSMR